MRNDQPDLLRLRDAKAIVAPKVKATVEKEGGLKAPKTFFVTLDHVPEDHSYDESDIIEETCDGTTMKGVGFPSCFLRTKGFDARRRKRWLFCHAMVKSVLNLLSFIL